MERRSKQEVIKVSLLQKNGIKQGGVPVQLNILYTGGLFYCYMLDVSIYHFRGVRSILQ